ncbi:hypothetical protein F4813DRAFT_205206 [Daldinia decipiens]|uniref:uncharacterized protein n=1 Tax=Daldinia decipiens TaxID=326647 RepID=UPI0020C32995|nr:uncharacterized protein F4813DRAFT_205206 [Daldinia decipiens]KAI1654588.1 hypothetical protein F4813DRAFT_205206 [Daldinia decipiens]
MPRYTPSSPSSSQTPRPRSSSCSRCNTSTNTKQRRQRSRSPSHSDERKDVLKTSLVFLGAVGAASLAASRFWPKGILYGEKESWAQEAKEEVKHALGGNKPDNIENRRRTRSASHGSGGSRRRQPPRVEIRDEIVAARPGDHSMYANTGRTRQYDDADGDRGRRYRSDPGERRFNNEPSRLRKPRALYSDI